MKDFKVNALEMDLPEYGEQSITRTGKVVDVQFVSAGRMGGLVTVDIKGEKIKYLVGCGFPLAMRVGEKVRVSGQPACIQELRFENQPYRKASIKKLRPEGEGS